MKPHKTLLMMSPILFTTPAIADVSSDCKKLSRCVEVVQKLTGDRYVYDPATKFRSGASSNLKFTSANAVTIFTQILNMNMLTRVPTGTKGVYSIQGQRQARDLAIPLFEASKRQQPQLPKNHDMITMQYKAENPEAIEAIARNMRSFMPANSRVIPSTLSGTLLITDSAMNVAKVYSMIVEMDVKPSKAMLKKWNERRKEWRKNKCGCGKSKDIKG